MSEKNGTAAAVGADNRSMLNQMQTFKLMLFVDGNRDRIAKERKTLADWAAEASKHLGFVVTKGNIQGAIHPHGIERVAPTAVRPSGGKYLEPVREKVAALERTVAEQSEQIAALLSRVTALENAITEPTPLRLVNGRG